MRQEIRIREARRLAEARGERVIDAHLVPRTAGPAALGEAAPSFLRSLFGFNRRQVEAYVASQQEQLIRARERAVEAEEELWRLRRQLDEAVALVSGDPRPQFSLTRGGETGRPRHLRRSAGERLA